MAVEYSKRVFIGGLPIDTKETDLKYAFGRFGPFEVDWDPRSLERNAHRGASIKNAVKGFAFLVFSEEAAVHKLLNMECIKEGDSYYTFFTSRTMKKKTVQVRPWRLSDSTYMPDPNFPLNPDYTVYIGALPRQIKASQLALLLGRMFGPVVYANIDVEPKMQYPKGAARITFARYQSYLAALKCHFVEVPNAGGVNKQVEMKPYLIADHHCDNCCGDLCQGRAATNFCAHISCLQYYCDVCWDKMHYSDRVAPLRMTHKPTRTGLK